MAYVTRRTWIESPVTQCAFLAAFLTAGLVFLASRREPAGVRKRMKGPEICPSPEPYSRMDSAWRSRILGMDSGGDTVASISSALGVPQNEIELLLKVQRLANPKHT
jgi:hypothetical protein